MNRDHEKVTYGGDGSVTVTNDAPAKSKDPAKHLEMITHTGLKMPREIQRVDGRRLDEHRPGPDWFRKKALERRFNHTGGGALHGLSIWMRRRILAISTCVTAAAPDGSGDAIPQWHISFTNEGRRCTDEEVRQSLAAFRLTGADEDNHEPGMARHYWMPLDPARRTDCECKTTEKTVTLPDGHRWTTPVDDRECYGCKHEVEMFAAGIKRPCPIHALQGAAVAQQARIDAGHATAPADDRALAAGYALRHAEITHKIPEGMMLGEGGGLVPNDVKGEPIKGLLVDSLEPDPNYRGPQWGDSTILTVMRRLQGPAVGIGVSVGYHVASARAGSPRRNARDRRRSSVNWRDARGDRGTRRESRRNGDDRGPAAHA